MRHRGFHGWHPICPLLVLYEFPRITLADAIAELKLCGVQSIAAFPVPSRRCGGSHPLGPDAKKFPLFSKKITFVNGPRYRFVNAKQPPANP
jgi:hypothetical protein